MSPQSRFVMLILLLTSWSLLLNIGGCARSASNNQSRDSSGQTSKPKQITPADLVKLRWIEGSWRGTGDVETPFYERYHFENESTLVVDSFDDDKLSKVSDTTRFELKDGQFGNVGEGSRWVATAIDDSSITFEPVAKARNSFSWKRESADLWQADLNWPASDKGPAKERIYRMERWPTAKR